MKANKTQRTLVKGFSFEVWSNLLGLFLSYLWFGNFRCCLAFTGVCFVFKTALFFFHERAWHYCRRGKNPKAVPNQEQGT